MGFLGSGNLSRLVSEAFEVGWSEDFRFGGHKSSVCGSDLGYSGPDSWLLALALKVPFWLLPKSKGKGSILGASSV